jgi:hypothetical protein
LFIVPCDPAIIPKAPRRQFAITWLVSTFPADTAAFLPGDNILFSGIKIVIGLKIPELRGISLSIKHLKTYRITAFVIGNGTQWNATSDAFVVYFNGNATLSGDLTINSDERLKENIQPLGSTLNKLNQIEGWTYSLKKDEEHTPKIGVLAQEVQAVFPELVTEGGDGILSVNYQGLVPVLINAINEQDAKIAALEAQNAEIKELKEMVRRLALKQSKTSSTEASN